MTYSIDRIKELVPEARHEICFDKPAGEIFVMTNEDGNVFGITKTSPFWIALLTTRAEVERLQGNLTEALELLRKITGPAPSSDFITKFEDSNHRERREFLARHALEKGE